MSVLQLDVRPTWAVTVPAVQRARQGQARFGEMVRARRDAQHAAAEVAAEPVPA